MRGRGGEEESSEPLFCSTRVKDIHVAFGAGTVVLDGDTANRVCCDSEYLRRECNEKVVPGVCPVHIRNLGSTSAVGCSVRGGHVERAGSEFRGWGSCSAEHRRRGVPSLQRGLRVLAQRRIRRRGVV